MKLLPLDRPDLIALVGSWLNQEENWKWLDFGNGVQRLTPVSLKVMTRRDIHCLRVFTPDEDDRPIGVVGLNNIHRSFKTAGVWCVLGDKRYGGMGTRAVSRMLTVAFSELCLEAVNCWTVEVNQPARRLVEHLGFTFIGRQRRCHRIDGQVYDRFLFDILAPEHKEM